MTNDEMNNELTGLADEICDLVTDFFIRGAIITVFLASAGTVKAANNLDGKALLCSSASTIRPVYGLVFDKGKVSRWQLASTRLKE
ncbi:MAG: hypothetical protein ACKVK8_06270 [Rhodospirillales bacterium]|jgi:hypothetical protein